MVNQRGIDPNLQKIKMLLEMSSPKKPKEVMSLAGRVAALNGFVLLETDHCAPFFDVLKWSKTLSGLRNPSKHSRPSRNT